MYLSHQVIKPCDVYAHVGTMKYHDNYLQLKEKCNKTNKQSPFPSVLSLWVLPLPVIFGGGFKHLSGEAAPSEKKQSKKEISTQRQTVFQLSSAELRNQPQLQLPTRFPWLVWCSAKMNWQRALTKPALGQGESAPLQLEKAVKPFSSAVISHTPVHTCSHMKCKSQDMWMNN